MAQTFTFGSAMGVGVRVSLRDQARTVAAIKSLGPQIHGEVTKAIVSAAIEAQSFAKQAAPVDTGVLRAQINIFVSSDKLRAGIVANAKYASFVEYGTGQAGAATNKQTLPAGYVHGPDHKVGGKRLVGWARRHGLNPFAVAAGIRKRGGTKARPFMGPAFERVRLKFQARIAALLATVKKP